MPKHLRYLSYRQAVLILIMAPLVSSCWTFHKPQDVALVRIAAANGDELPQGDRLHSYKYSDPRELIRLYPQGKLLAVTLSSTTELAAIERFFYYEASICPEGRGAKLDRSSDIFEQHDDQLFQVALLRAGWRPNRTSDSDTSVHLYKIYFFDRVVFRHGSSEPRPYNLSVSPEDVCITIHGVAELLPSYESNTIIIPAAEIKRALD